MPINGLPAEAIIGGRIVVDEFCKVKVCDDIYAIGDVASMTLDDFPKGHPMVAPVINKQFSFICFLLQ
jgi:NADH dehydrogenase